jgi:hypothetical protein
MATQEGNSQVPELGSIERRLANLTDRVKQLERGPEDPTLALSRDLVDLGEVPSCGVHKTADIDLVTATWTEISFGTVTWDTGQMADTANSGITIQRAGLYHVTLNARFVDATAGSRKLYVTVNDSTIFLGTVCGAVGGNNPRLSCGNLRYFDLGDTITAQAYQDSGGNLLLKGSEATQLGPQLTATLIANVGDIRTEMA